MKGYRAFSSMCEIVDAYPPRSENASQVAAQVRESGCELSASPTSSALRSVAGLACGIVSEFSIPGTQHLVERACKTIIGAD
jgi:hypothetical protein